MNKKKGFTVVELLVTTSVLIVILSMSIMLSRSVTSRSKLDGLTRTLKSDIKYARQLAINQNRYVIVDFNNQGNGYSIVVQKVASKMLSNPPADNWLKVKNKTNVRPNKAVFFDNNNVNDIAFNPSGESVDCSSTTTITGKELTDVTVNATFNLNNSPREVENDLFVLKDDTDNSSGQKDYERKLIVVPYGGVKIEKCK